MTVTESTEALVEEHYRALADLPPAVKVGVAKKLQASVEANPDQTPKSSILDYFGAWEDDRSAEEIAREIRESRVDSGHRAVFD